MSTVRQPSMSALEETYPLRRRRLRRERHPSSALSTPPRQLELVE
ncbi:MAG TPA: hypothetical protein VJ649_04975 [Actinomycetes bacterium]|nr:hypothetical protein [Actinomycetes bacterium]